LLCLSFSQRILAARRWQWAFSIPQVGLTGSMELLVRPSTQLSGPLQQAICIALPGIGMHCAAGLDAIFNERRQAGGRGLLDYPHANPTDALSIRLTVAARTLEQVGTNRPRLATSATWTSKPLRPPQWKEVLATAFLGREPGLEL
jgi:hypothetical protein